MPSPADTINPIPEKKPDPQKDTSQPGREEEVIKQSENSPRTKGGISQNTKEDAGGLGEKRFREGLAHNDAEDYDQA